MNQNCDYCSKPAQLFSQRVRPARTHGIMALRRGACVDRMWLCGEHRDKWNQTRPNGTPELLVVAHRPDAELIAGAESVTEKP